MKTPSFVPALAVATVAACGSIPQNTPTSADTGKHTVSISLGEDCKGEPNLWRCLIKGNSLPTLNRSGTLAELIAVCFKKQNNSRYDLRGDFGAAVADNAVLRITVTDISTRISNLTGEDVTEVRKTLLYQDGPFAIDKSTGVFPKSIDTGGKGVQLVIEECVIESSQPKETSTETSEKPQKTPAAQ